MAYSECLLNGFWGMSAQSNFFTRLPRLCCTPEYGKMIILDKYIRLLINLAFKRPGKFLIHFLVTRPVIGPENWPCMGDMTQRPYALIRETVIITFLFLL